MSDNTLLALSPRGLRAIGRGTIDLRQAPLTRDGRGVDIALEAEVGDDHHAVIAETLDGVLRDWISHASGRVMHGGDRYDDAAAPCGGRATSASPAMGTPLAKTSRLPTEPVHSQIPGRPDATRRSSPLRRRPNPHARIGEGCRSIRMGPRASRHVAGPTGEPRFPPVSVALCQGSQVGQRQSSNRPGNLCGIPLLLSGPITGSTHVHMHRLFSPGG